MNTKIAWLAPLALAACTPGDTADRSAGDPAEGTKAAEQTAAGQAPGDPDDRRPFAEIAPGETVRFTGTEPFWGGEVIGGTLTYSTPENIDGSPIAVERFAGRGGLAFSGEHDGAPFDMTVTQGACSDGMSDRTYPYTVTLSVAGEQRRGCAWTDDNPRSVPPGYDP